MSINSTTATSSQSFLPDVIHLLDDAAHTKAKINQFCSYFSKWLRDNESQLPTNTPELKRLRAWALASYVHISTHTHECTHTQTHTQ